MLSEIEPAVYPAFRKSRLRFFFIGGAEKISPETFTMNYDQYIAKLSSGRVCGMVDQHWNFQTAENSIKQQGLDDCTYVPVGVVIDSGITERYHTPDALDVSNGIGQGDYSIGTAAGIFKSLVSIILIVIANKSAKLMGEEHLF